jgi:hypothetical protein
MVAMRVLGWTPVQIADGAEPVSFDEAVATEMLLDRN